MATKLTKKGPNVPTDPRALKRLERYIEVGHLEELSNLAGIPSVPRYLVTYMIPRRVVPFDQQRSYPSQISQTE